jgi:hypothetical protein
MIEPRDRLTDTPHCVAFQLRWSSQQQHRYAEGTGRTAALAAAGPGARLLAPRLAVGPVTCALAESEITP